MPITTLKQSVQVLIKVIRWLIFKKHNSIFSKRLTLPWGTAIVISWLNSSTNISGFIVFCLILNELSHWIWGEGGYLFCSFFLFLLISRYTHTLRWPLKWKDVIQVIDLTQMKQDLLIPHKSITSSAPSNGRERGWWGVCSSISITVSLWVQGDYFAELAAMEDTTQDQILEPLICKRWIDGKSLCSTSITLLQQKATVLKMIHFFGGERGDICVVTHQKGDWFNGAFHSVSI